MRRTTVSCVTGAIYHQLFYDTSGSLADFAEVGVAAAIIFVLPGIVHGEYELSHYLSFKAHVRRAKGDAEKLEVSVSFVPENPKEEICLPPATVTATVP